MRYTAFFSLILAAGLLASCGGKTKKVDSSIVQNSQTASEGGSSAKLAKIKFESTEYDFGEVLEGQEVTFSYKFTNTGENDLIIYDAKGSCGCTVPEKPEKPIPPGGTGEIFVKFNSEGRAGRASKTVTVAANTEPNSMELRLTGNVIPNK